MNAPDPSGQLLPWFVPGVIISTFVATAASSSVGRLLGTRRMVAGLLILSVGVIASATLTPQASALQGSIAGPTTCNLSRLTPAALSAYMAGGETLGNVLMFLPLGLAIGLIGERRTRLALLGAALLLPLVIELTQLVAWPLGRACESADVVDNLLGLAVGFALAVSARVATGLMAGR